MKELIKQELTTQLIGFSLNDEIDKSYIENEAMSIVIINLPEIYANYTIGEIEEAIEEWVEEI